MKIFDSHSAVEKVFTSVIKPQQVLSVYWFGDNDPGRFLTETKSQKP